MDGEVKKHVVMNIHFFFLESDDKLFESLLNTMAETHADFTGSHPSLYLEIILSDA